MEHPGQGPLPGEQLSIEDALENAANSESQSGISKTLQEKIAKINQNQSETMANLDKIGNPETDQPIDTAEQVQQETKLPEVSLKVGKALTAVFKEAIRSSQVLPDKVIPVSRAIIKRTIIEIETELAELKGVDADVNRLSAIWGSFNLDDFADERIHLVDVLNDRLDELDEMAKKIEIYKQAAVVLNERYPVDDINRKTFGRGKR